MDFSFRLCNITRLCGSTVVDGPEVPEDRDPAQREAEGPQNSHCSISLTKKPELQRHHTA